MNNRKRKKQTITLLEIMIVIFLIGLIGSVVGYNIKGSLDEGRAFRSEQGAAQIRDILLFEVARGTSIEKVIEDKQAYLENSGLVKDSSKLLKDGWGEEYEVYAIKNGSDIAVKSKKLKAYQNKKKARLKENEEEEAQDEGEEF